MFFSIDGVDGAGKSTQVSRLLANLQRVGFQTVRCRDPGSTEVGDSIRDVLLHRHELKITAMCEMFLFMAARNQLVEEVIRPAMAAEKIVVCDRFLLSSIVYQGYAGGVPVEEVESVGRLATGGTMPNLTFVLDVPQNTGATRLRSRGSLDRMEQKDSSFQQQLRDSFLRHAQTDPLRYVLIDGLQSPEEIEQEIWQHVHPLLPVLTDRK